MVRRAATEPKTGFTGVVLVASFAMFRPLMAMFNAGIALPPPFRRWDLSVMVETQGGRERAVRCGGCGASRLLQMIPFGEEFTTVVDERH